MDINCQSRLYRAHTLGSRRWPKVMERFICILFLSNLIIQLFVLYFIVIFITKVQLLDDTKPC